MRYTILCMLWITVFPVFGSTTKASWSDYFGTHYEAASWGASLRDPGGPGRFGYWLPSARNSNRLTTADSGTLDELRRQIERGAVVINVGGLGTGRDTQMVSDFLNEVQKSRATTWKHELAERVRRVASVPGAEDLVYWQFGNEINGPRFLNNLAQWGGVKGANAEETMREVIPIYVENFLAPGVETVHQVSQQVYGNSQRIHVMLGSLANARNPRSLGWYDELLNYTVRGDYAKSLAGRKVYEIVDTLSVHYLVSAPDNGWENILDTLTQKWIGRGSVRRIWSTEELGVRRAQAGQGASIALRVAARYLDWWLRHELTPDQGHCFFWGAEMGGEGKRADDALNTIFEFTGKAALERLPSADTGDLESYHFSVAGNRKRVLIAFPQGRWVGEDATFKGASLPVSGWNGPMRIRLLHYTPEGVQSIAVDISGKKGDVYRITPDELVKLREGSALLFLIERR